jgi:subtilisin family serine protease
MTTAADVVRRFEIHVASENAVKEVARAIDQALATPRVARRVHEVRRPPMLEVRLEGASSLVTEAMASIIERLPGARIRNDVMRTRKDGRKDPVYPDPEARVRVGADSLSRSVAVPVTVTIVDSGLMVEHPAFKDHLWTGGDGAPGKQFIKDPDGKDRPSDDIRDQDGHGTLLAGTVLDAAVDTPVKLMVAKFFDAAHPARPDNAANALDFAVDNHAQVILLAWDVGVGSITLEKGFHKACQRALVVVAAGNYGSDNDWHDYQTLARAPVRYAKDDRESTIVVMAADESGKAWFSNYGRESVDLAAPGIAITSTRRCLSKEAARTPVAYRTHGGTSAAAALVAGAAVLLMSRYPGLRVQQVKSCLIDSVDKFPGLKCASGGRLNIGAALRRAAEEANKR